MSSFVNASASSFLHSFCSYFSTVITLKKVLFNYVRSWPSFVDVLLPISKEANFLFLSLVQHSPKESSLLHYLHRGPSSHSSRLPKTDLYGPSTCKLSILLAVSTRHFQCRRHLERQPRFHCQRVYCRHFKRH